mgnify:FL=1
MISSGNVMCDSGAVSAELPEQVKIILVYGRFGYGAAVEGASAENAREDYSGGDDNTEATTDRR